MDLKKLEESLIVKMQEMFKFLEEKWLSISLSESQKIPRTTAVYKNISDLCDRIVLDEENMIERIISRIRNSKLEIFHLSQELNITFEEFEDLPPLHLDNFLQNKLSELQEEKRQRLSELEDLSEKDESICKYMGEATHHLVHKDFIPAKEDLDLLKKHVQEMEEEKTLRTETYENLRNDILSFVEQLERPLESEVILDVVCSAKRETSLTKEYLNELKKLHAEMEFEVKELESQSSELRDKIASLWHLLKVPQEDRDAFLATVPSHTPSCIIKLENQVSEMKEMRHKNLGLFVQELRIELEKCWEKCYVGEKERNAFAPLSSDKVSEDVLDAYEVEVKKWTHFYADNRVVLEKVDYFLALFHNMLQLEEKAKDPSRLFNRGGSLLQEEKERKRVKAVLPQVQEQLIDLCSEFEKRNEHPFLIDGCSVQEYLGNIWEHHDTQREREKSNRLQVKKTPCGAAKGSRSAKKTPLPPSSVSQVGSRKRGREADEHFVGRTPNAKKAATHAHLASPAKMRRPPAMGPFSVPRAGKALTERDHLAPPLMQPIDTDENNLHHPISYDNFKEILRSRSENFNSTTLSVAAHDDDDNDGRHHHRHKEEEEKEDENAALKTLNMNEVVHSSVLHCESPISTKNTPTGRRGFHDDDAEREKRLKGTLNLASPSKKAGTTHHRRTSSVQGGASGGAFLVRSSSHPSLMRSPSVSPAKMGVESNRMWRF